MNAFMKRLQQARKGDETSFNYTGQDGKSKTYRRSKTKTGMVIYKTAAKPVKRKTKRKTK